MARQAPRARLPLLGHDGKIRTINRQSTAIVVDGLARRFAGVQPLFDGIEPIAKNQERGFAAEFQALDVEGRLILQPAFGGGAFGLPARGANLAGGGLMIDAAELVELTGGGIGVLPFLGAIGKLGDFPQHADIDENQLVGEVVGDLEILVIGFVLLRFAAESLDLGAVFLVLEPNPIAALAPATEVLRADGLAIEALLQEFLGFRQTVEPVEDGIGDLAPFETTVDFFADRLSEEGDFSPAGSGERNFDERLVRGEGGLDRIWRRDIHKNGGARLKVCLRRQDFGGHGRAEWRLEPVRGERVKLGHERDGAQRMEDAGLVRSVAGLGNRCL